MSDHVAEPKLAYGYKSNTNRMGLWLFILSDAFVFVALMVARFYLMGGTRPELNQTLGLVVTGMLLVSSFFMNRAEIAIQAGNMKGFLRFTGITLALGVLFLIGVVGVEWQIAHFGPADGAAGSIFYTMTGFHAFHVLTGVIFLTVIFLNGRKGLYTKEEHFPVEAAAIYWHFVDVVWFFFYPALYLIGEVIG